MSTCIFCHKSMPSRSAEDCTYGLGHEWEDVIKPKQVAKPDLARCSKCGVHPKNPLSATNGCAHEYAQ